MYGDPLPIHLAVNCSSKNVRNTLAKGGEPHLAGKLFRVLDLADLQERIYATVNSITP